MAFKPRKAPPGGYPKNNFKMAPWYIRELKGFGPGGAAGYTQRKPKKR